MTASQTKAQRGGFTMGLIVGLMIGLALALGVALYVTKAPNPFVNKVPPRSAVQDAAEAERNRNWDPNSALGGRAPVRPPPGAVVGGSAGGPIARPAEIPATPGSAALPGVASSRSAPPAPTASTPARAPMAATPFPFERPAIAPPTTRAPPPVSTGASADPFTYFVQAGAYGRSEDAEQQRARLAMLGIESRLTEREQSGRTVYRIRVGPFEHKGDADATKEKLSGAGVDAALIRVQK